MAAVQGGTVESSSVSGLLTCGAFVLIAVAFNYSSLQLAVPPPLTAYFQRCIALFRP